MNFMTLAEEYSFNFASCEPSCMLKIAGFMDLYVEYFRIWPKSQCSLILHCAKVVYFTYYYYCIVKLKTVM